MVAGNAKTLLLVSADEAWSSFVADTVPEFSVEFAVDLNRLPDGSFGIVVFDASLTIHIAQTVELLLTRFAGSRLVVVAADPSWKEARAVLLAGANDYLSKSYNVVDFRNALKHVIEG